MVLLSETPRSVRRRWAIPAAALFAGAALLLLARTAWDPVADRVAGSRKVQCANNLKNLGGMLVQRLTGKGLRRDRGPAMLLDLYSLGMIRKGDERMFLCPCDPNAERLDDLEFRRKYADIGLRGPDSSLLSYAVRDTARFPPGRDARGPEPLALCPWHPDGVNVLYDDGSVRFLDREDLGLGPGVPVATGPDAGCELLRRFAPLGR